MISDVEHYFMYLLAILWYDIHTVEQYSNIEKGNPAVCNNMNEARGDYAQKNYPERRLYKIHSKLYCEKVNPRQIPVFL